MTDKPPRQRLADFADPEGGYTADEAADLFAFTAELVDRIEQLEYENERLSAADTRPDWGRPTELGEPDRNPND